MASVDDASPSWAGRGRLDELCGARLAGAVLDGLWVGGSLDGLLAPSVAIVGTRAPSDAGRHHAYGLARSLGRAGVCVVSGLALGIDAAAHEGALAAAAPTIGVLGGGHARFFPARNRGLGDRMVSGGGAVVSPYAPDTPAKPWQFLQRNAVIATLVDAVVVVEAAARSGSLNTAGHAADRGIPVLAFPGDVERPKAAGCNALIRDGATLVRNAEDVLAALPSHMRPTTQCRPERAIAPRGASRIRTVRLPPQVDAELARRVIATLGHGASDPGCLADALGAPPTTLFPLLAELEVVGTITLGADGYSLARR